LSRQLFAAGQTSPHGLENRRWRIAKYLANGSNGGGEKRLIDAAKTAEIEFENGAIHGSPTCGVLVGPYTLSGNQLTVQPDFVLNGFCPTEQLAQNQQVLNALKGDLRIEEKDNHIILRDKSGQVRVLLVPY
jgi:heat shock protein HslJ